jgi:hypothetical protein
MAPDIGDIIQKIGSDPSKFETFRVTGWMKAMPDMVDPGPDASFMDSFCFELWQEAEASGDGRHGPDKKRLIWCIREEAEYVCGAGVCGVLWRIADCEVIGRVKWTEESIASERNHALCLVGERLI